MKLQGSQTITAVPTEVWPILMDSARLTQVIPGCQALEPLGENRFRCILNIPVGPLKGQFDGVVTVSLVYPVDSFQVDFEGQSPLGPVQGNGRIQLHDHDDNTIIQYDGDFLVGGKLAKISPRLLEANVNALIRRSAESIGQMLQPQTQEMGTLPDRAVYPWGSHPRKIFIAGLFTLAALLTALFIGKKYLESKQGDEEQGGNGHAL